MASCLEHRLPLHRFPTQCLVCLWLMRTNPGTKPKPGTGRPVDVNIDLSSLSGLRFYSKRLGG